METTYQIGHEALSGKISVNSIKAALRKHPANRAEILIAATTDALETRPDAAGAELALRMLKAAAAVLDGAQPKPRKRS